MFFDGVAHFELESFSELPSGDRASFSFDWLTGTVEAGDSSPELLVGDIGNLLGVLGSAFDFVRPLVRFCTEKAAAEFGLRHSGGQLLGDEVVGDAVLRESLESDCFKTVSRVVEEVRDNCERDELDTVSLPSVNKLLIRSEPEAAAHLAATSLMFTSSTPIVSYRTAKILLSLQ